ncbi:Abi-domain-containing protein [Anaeromyces robustus]|jgi:membrane protease YdiL (CAAX protease family)|uniref:Abi-domain-containing protein n=1 Tax=Anaeromyces robustus TaxID=1754192 RepID=A0A1Y1X1F9_9FUNG|nr:Abi-domain-containing protein [Anaeromyces robustus]|eukprot:ORX79495.1 Abi-domain-containing protein [Anaeromyces robustus]
MVDKVSENNSKENDTVIDVQEPEQTVVTITKDVNNSQEKKKKVNIFKQFLLKRVYLTAISCYLIYIVLNIVYNLLFNDLVLKFKENVLGIKNTENVTSSNQLSLMEELGNSKIILLTLLYMIVIGPILEEIIFRLCIFRPIDLLGIKVRKSNKFFGWLIIALAFIISSSIFAYAHFNLNLDTLAKELEFFPQYFLMGFMFAAAYHYDGYLAASMLTHILNNLVATLLMFLASSINGTIFINTTNINNSLIMKFLH